jgi:HK97 family phage major capsid protein
MDELKKQIFNHLEKMEENASATKKELDGQVETIVANGQKEVEQLRSEISAIKNIGGVKNLDKKIKIALGNSLKELGGVILSEKEVTFEALQKDFIAIDPTNPADAEGDLAGTQVYNSILEIAENYGTLFPHAGKIVVGERNFKFIKGDNLPIDTGGFYKEGVDIDLDKLKFTSVTVSPEDWFRIIAVAISTLEDANPEDLGVYILNELGKNYATLLDNQVASAMNTVITQNVAIANLSALTPKSVLQVKALVNDTYRNKGKFYTTFSNYIELVTLQDGNGVYLFPITEKEDKLYLNGSQFIISDQIEAGIGAGDAFLYFGELEETVVIFERKALTITQGEKFVSDLKLYKAKARIKVEGKIPQASAKLILTA